MNAFVLSSGGIDSTACIIYYLNTGMRVLPIFIDFGHPSNAVEREHVHQIAAYYKLTLREIKISGVDCCQLGEIKGRNAAFVTVALMAYTNLPGIVALGIHAGSPYYDCTPAFADRISVLVSEYTNGLMQFEAPFLNFEKPSIVAFGKKYGLPFDLTYSCQKGTASPCGICLSCLDRKVLGL
jgi:7-cyano-7-deazaguanine synthase